MTSSNAPTDLEIAALISSKICHDVIGPVGAINNGLEILDEEDDPNARTYALDMIRNVTQTASAALQFARFAFGASGSAGALIDLTMAEQISRGYVVQGKGKHKLTWSGPPGHMQKDKVKLLLNLVAAAITALPRGGEIAVTIAGGVDAPTFEIKCVGTGARPPQYLPEFIAKVGAPPLDALTIQAYYTARLADTAGMVLSIAKSDADVLLSARAA
ncbi:MAG: histidine phosphotransferase family protein [Hyphomicrobium sp.]|nr:histidine phosphotransferase family protein [Hyphomicrobium sp.]